MPGFVANRLQEALWREALHMVAAGEATVEQIDQSITDGPGLRWPVQGPCLTFHLAGGQGGMAHMLDHFGPSLLSPWTRLVSTELTPELRDAMVAGTEREAAGRTHRRARRRSGTRDHRDPAGAGARVTADDGAGRPFERYRTEVRAEWVDYNDHMNDAAYAVVLGEANEVLLDALGLSAEYRDRTGAGLYTVESHLRYLAECALGQVLTAATLLVSADARKVHLHTELLDEDRRPVATGEYLYLHVDPHAGRTTPMPPDRQAEVAAVLTAHAALPRPAHLGRGIAARTTGNEATG